MKFRFEAFFWEISLNDAGSSFQILAPTLEKTLFWRSSLDFLMWKLFDGGRPSAVRMNTISIAEYLSISYIVRSPSNGLLTSCINQQTLAGQIKRPPLPPGLLER